MNNSAEQLIFVYNADSGLANALLDAGHKVLSPGTYSCNLCALTHGVVGEKKAWKRFRKSLPVPMVFLHRNEFETQFGQEMTYPVVLLQVGDTITPVITTETLQGMSSLDELMEAIGRLV